MFDAGSPEDSPGALGGLQGDAAMWTSQRMELLGWLNTYAPALVPLYRGALSLAMRDSFPGRVHLIAHAIREIRDRLPGALGPKVQRRDAGYEHLTDRIHKRWVDEGLPQDGRLRLPEGSAPSESGPARREVSHQFLAAVGRLIEAHTEARANREARERSGFRALSEHGPSPQYVVKNWNDLFPDAHQYAHSWDEPLPAGADGEWVENFFVFERHLMAVFRPAYENLADLDKLLGEANN